MTPEEEALAQAHQLCEGVENADPQSLAIALTTLVRAKQELEVERDQWRWAYEKHEAILKVVRQERDNLQAKMDFYASELAFMRKRLDAQ